jgi:hypothetical protein
MREKYSFMSSHEIWRWFHPRGCKKLVKPSAKPRVLPLFATLGWNHLIFHGYSWKSLIIFIHYNMKDNCKTLFLISFLFFVFCIWTFSLQRLYSKPCATYETASLRQFQLGRTDTIRSCSTESLEFSKGMMDPALSTQKKAELLRKAVTGHKNYVAEVWCTLTLYQ